MNKDVLEYDTMTRIVKMEKLTVIHKHNLVIIKDNTHLFLQLTFEVFLV